MTEKSVPSGQTQNSFCKAIISHSPVPMLLCDKDGCVIFFNAAYCTLFGISDSDLPEGIPLAKIETPWKEYNTDGTLLDFRDTPLARLKEGGQICFEEIRIVRKDATERWYSSSITPLFNESGELEASFLTCFDKTVHKETHDELGENRALFHSLVQSIPHNIFSKDKEGRFTFANNRYCITEGRSLHDILGKSDYDLHPAEFADKYVADDRRVMETEEIFQAVETHYPKDGSPVHVQVVKAPLYDAERKVRGMIGIFWDITEKKEAEEALKRSEAQIRDLARNIPGAIFQFTPIGDKKIKFSYLSEQTEKLLGIIHTDPDFTEKLIQGIPEEERLETLNSIANSVRNMRSCECVFPFIRPDGSKVWIHAIASPNRNCNSVVFNGVFLDITRNKSIEERNRELEQQFYSAQRMKAVGTLAGGIAHNINNVLMGIQGRISLINMEPEDIESCLEHVKLIEQYVSNAADMTKDLLAFARGGKYEVKPTDINSFIRKEANLFEKTRRDIVIKEVFQENIPSVEIDRNQMRQVLLNLFLNSSQAMPSGGSITIETMSIDLDEQSAAARSVEAGNFVELRISDTGTGMDEETQKKVFEPFFSRRNQGKGTGLGLSSAYGIIRNHGGFIDIQSTLEKGTTVTIFLPSSTKAPVYDVEQIPKISTGRQSILLIDDEKMILDVGEKMLQKIGYTVHTCSSGKEGIDFVEASNENIDAVIIDMIMPQLSGSETARRIRKIRPDIPILFSSGYSEEEKIHETVSDLKGGFIQKPYTIQDLSHKLKELLTDE